MTRRAQTERGFAADRPPRQRPALDDNEQRRCFHRFEEYLIDLCLTEYGGGIES